MEDLDRVIEPRGPLQADRVSYTETETDPASAPVRPKQGLARLAKGLLVASQNLPKPKSGLQRKLFRPI